MNKSVVTIEDVNAALYDSNVMVTGNIKDTDTQNPEYNLKIKTDDFNISNLNNIEKITIMPEQIKYQKKKKIPNKALKVPQPKTTRQCGRFNLLKKKKN